MAVVFALQVAACLLQQPGLITGLYAELWPVITIMAMEMHSFKVKLKVQYQTIGSKFGCSALILPLQGTGLHAADPCTHTDKKHVKYELQLSPS